MKLAVLDCGSGNLASVARALVRAASDQGLAATVTITSDPEAVQSADRIILPGQGAFAACAAGLASAPGLKAALIAAVASGVPFLGICVGMQLMAARGLEHGTTPGLGWIAGEIAPLAAPGLRLPHMGWNDLRFTEPAHPLLAGLHQGAHAYFVHSYALSGAAGADILATTDYGGTVPALVARGNVAGTQFHVEKSQAVGLTLLGNFLRWTP